MKYLPLSFSREKLKVDYFLFVFNLNTAEDSKALSPISRADLRFEMIFRAPLPHSTNLIVYACYDSIPNCKCWCTTTESLPHRAKRAINTYWLERLMCH